MAQFELIIPPGELRDAQRNLEEVLHRRMRRCPGSYMIGHQGGSSTGNTVQANGRIWYCGKTLRNEAVPRYWNAFGLISDLRPTGSNRIAVEINPPLSGSSGRVAGVFARDLKTGATVVLHTGKIGGGKTGVGKEAFLAATTREIVTVENPEKGKKPREGFVIARLDDPAAVRGISDFVEEVAAFKSGDIETLSVAQLLKLAKTAPELPKRKARISFAFDRSEIISRLAKLRANGRCDLCLQRAPFEVAGKPFLECHHIQLLAEHGKDNLRNTVALCPNCHRRMHHLADEADQRKLRKRIEKATF